MQVGGGLPTLMLIVPFGGLETPEEHVLLQPAREIPSKGSARKRKFQKWRRQRA
jgi:hypothetical protein